MGRKLQQTQGVRDKKGDESDAMKRPALHRQKPEHEPRRHEHRAEERHAVKLLKGLLGLNRLADAEQSPTVLAAVPCHRAGDEDLRQGRGVRAIAVRAAPGICRQGASVSVTRARASLGRTLSYICQLDMEKRHKNFRGPASHLLLVRIAWLILLRRRLFGRVERPLMLAGGTLLEGERLTVPREDNLMCQDFLVTFGTRHRPYIHSVTNDARLHSVSPISGAIRLRASQHSTTNVATVEPPSQGFLGLILFIHALAS